MDDKALVEAIRAGTPEAFEELLRRHQAPVRGYLARFVRDRDAVRDLAQETFLGAYRNLGDWRGDAPLRAWLLAIARSQALMHLRRESRRPVDALSREVDAWIADRLDGAVDDHDPRLSALRACLKELPPPASGLIEAYYFRGRTAPDIARQTGRKETAVWMSLSRLRQLLRQCVQGRLGDAHP